MAAETMQSQTVPPLPPRGEAVTEQQLYLQQISLYRNALAFGGQQNPSVVWSSMIYNHPTVMAYYRELEEKDENVANALDTLKLAVLQRDRMVSPAGKKDGSTAGSPMKTTQADKVAEFVQQSLEALPNFHAVLDSMLDAPGYGFSVAELVYDVSESQVQLADVRDCPQELFLFGQRYRPQIGQLQLLDSPWAMEGTPQPEEKFAVFTCRPRGRNRMGRPLLRGVFWPSWFLRNVQRLWLQRCEKGAGTVITRYNDSDSPAQQARAAEIAKAILENPAVGVPAGLALETDLLKDVRAISPDIYLKLYQALQYNIARRILGETLTSFGNEGGTGARAQGEVHQETLEQRVIELCRALESVVARCIIRPLVLWNFGPDAPIPTWSLDTEEEEDLVARITVDSALQRMGKQIPTNYVVDRYSMPAVDGEPEVLVPNVNAPQVALQARDVSQFAERLGYAPGSREYQLFAEALAVKPEVAHELSEFDKIFSQLKGESLDVMKQRIGELVAAYAGHNLAKR